LLSGEHGGSRQRWEGRFGVGGEVGSAHASSSTEAHGLLVADGLIQTGSGIQGAREFVGRKQSSWVEGGVVEWGEGVCLAAKPRRITQRRPRTTAPFVEQSYSARPTLSKGFMPGLLGLWAYLEGNSVPAMFGDAYLLAT
jgi:hypothetical protein